jgi:hypothetical protein
VSCTLAERFQLRAVLTSVGTGQPRDLFEEIQDKVALCVKCVTPADPQATVDLLQILDTLVSCGYKNHLSKFFPALCAAAFHPQFSKLIGSPDTADGSSAWRQDSSMASIPSPFTTPMVAGTASAWCRVVHVVHIVCDAFKKHM